MNYSAFHWSEKARKYAETIGTIFNVKGRVNTVADLPSTGNKVGDLWLVGLATDPDLTEYAWLSFDNVTRWEKLGSTATSLAFSGLTGSPYDNTALSNALGSKYDASNPDGFTSNVGTVTSVNNTSPDSNGNVTITIPDPLPSQSGQSGKYLTTNGTSASWGSVSIPTVNDATLTIQKNGTDVATFTANSSTNQTANISVPTQASDISALDTNASNATAAGKSTIVGWGMPSGSYEDITVGISGATYEAPADGYFVVFCSFPTQASYVQLGGDRILCSVTPGYMGYSSLGTYLPVKKGYNMPMYYSDVTFSFFRFVYAEGEV